MRMLKGLEDVVSMSVLEPLYGPHGWRFGTSPGTSPDSVNGASELAEIYLRADPRYTGRVSVPALWDKERRTIVNNESAEIIRMLNGAFGRFTNVRTDYYPPALREEIDRVNALVFTRTSTMASIGRASPPHSKPYEEAFRALFGALDELEGRLSLQRYLVGKDISEADWRAIHDARAFRRSLLQPFQVQPAPHYRLPEPLQLPARPLSTAGCRCDREPGSDQAALLRQPAAREPDRHRAAGAAAGFFGSARPPQVRELEFVRGRIIALSQALGRGQIKPSLGIDDHAIVSPRVLRADEAVEHVVKDTLRIARARIADPAPSRELEADRVARRHRLPSFGADGPAGAQRHRARGTRTAAVASTRRVVH